MTEPTEHHYSDGELAMDVQLEWTDYLSVQYLDLRRRKGLVAFGILGLLIGVWVSYEGLQYGFRTGDWSFGLFFVPGLITFFLLLYLVILPIQTRKTFRQQRPLQVAQRWTLEENGLKISSELGTHHFPWSHVWRWLENRRLFVLYESARVMHMIPKRDLSASQEARLREVLESHVGPAGQRRRDS